MEQNIIQTDKVNTYEVKEKDCFSCEFLRLHPNRKMLCFRRENEGVIVEVTDLCMANLPCPARDVEVWDEWIDGEGNFRVDNECEYGYQAWLKKSEERRYEG